MSENKSIIHCKELLGCSNNPDRSKRSWLQWHGLQDFDRSKLVPCKNVSCFVLPAHMDFTHLVLSLLAVVPAKLKSNPDYQCSMSSEIHHLQLKFALFL